jgi:GT2 family glycosyltransferase
MDVSVIIVNWKSASYAKECVASIRALTRDVQYEIIVVDNASPDNSLEVLQGIPGIQLVHSPQNLGFARANNLGFQHSRGNALLFLNPDTRLVDRAIDLMYQSLMHSPTCAIAGCRILNADLTPQTSCIQNFPTIVNQLADIEWIRQRFPGIPMFGIAPLFHKQPTNVTPVQAVSGACLMVRRDTFEKAGCFNTDYFMYEEDIELCYQVRKAGGQVGHVSDATIIHYGGQSSRQAADAGFGDVVTRQSVYMFLTKTRGLWYARMYRLALTMSATLRIVLLSLLAAFLRGSSATTYWAGIRRRWTRILRWSVGLEQWATSPGALTTLKRNSA